MLAGTDREPAVDAKTPSSRIDEAGRTPEIVAASVYAHGKRVADVAIDEAGEWAKRPGHLVWIGLFEPSYEQRGDAHETDDLADRSEADEL